MNKLTSLKQLHYLVTLHEYQHFGRAAEACYISQSTLSTAITNLEHILETPLLERDHKTFMFTPLGEEIVKRSRIILAQTEELVDYAKNQSKLMQGNLYIGVIPTIAPFILNELHRLCHELYPNLTLFIREDTTDNILKLLGEGTLDLVIMALPYATQHFYVQELCKDYFQMVLPKKWLNKDYDQKINEFPDNSIFLLEKEHCLTGHALQVCQIKESKKINPFSATSLHTLIHMVSYQPGITFLPTLAINSGILNGTELVTLPLTNDHAYRKLGVAWRATSHKIHIYESLKLLIEQVLLDKLGKLP